MKLGIDGWRIHGNTGVPRYIGNILQHWTKELAGGCFNNINLYTPRPIDRTQTPLPVTINERVLKPDLRMLLWENLCLAPKCKDDVLWCPAYTSPLRTQAKVVVTTHDATLLLYPQLYSVAARMFYGRLYGRSAHHATLILTHNQTTCHDLSRCFGVPLEKIRVVPLAPAKIFKPLRDNQRVGEARQRYLGADHPFFLNVGKMSTRRNVPMIIEAFAQFKKLTKLPHKLLLVGQNALNLPLIDMATKFGIQHDLIHPDWVPDEDLVLLYNAAEAFVLAATYEANSFTSLEAQATGTPVIIPDTPGLREMTGDFALIMPKVGVQEITDALTRIATDGRFRNQLSEDGLKHASRFSWDRTSSETLAVLEEAARMKGPPMNTQKKTAFS